MTAKKEDKEESQAKTADEPKKTHASASPASGLGGFSLNDPAVKGKLPLLFLVLLFFAFAGFLFDRANFHAVDLVDLGRMQYNIGKLYSLVFILFLILYSLVLALSAHFGNGLKPLESLLVLPATLVPAVVLGLVFPKLLMVFAALALTAGAASFFSSRQPELTLSSTYRVLGRAMLVLMILAFVITFAKFSTNNAYYTDKLFSSVFDLVPDVGKQLSAAVASASVDETTLKSLISPDTFNNSVKLEAVQAAIEKIPGISNFNESLRQKWAGQVRAQLTSEEAYNQFITSAVESVKEIKAKLASQIENQTATPDGSLKTLATNQAKSIPQVKAALDNFPLIAAFTVLSLVSLVGFALKVLGTVFAWLLKKIAFG